MSDLEKRIAALEDQERQRPSIQDILEGLSSAIRTINNQQQAIDRMQKEAEVAIILFNVVCAGFDDLIKKQSTLDKSTQENVTDSTLQLSDLRNQIGILREKIARDGLPADFDFFEKLEHPI